MVPPGHCARVGVFQTALDLYQREGVERFVEDLHDQVRGCTRHSWLPHVFVFARRFDGEALDAPAVVHLMGHPGMATEDLCANARKASLDYEALGLLLQAPLNLHVEAMPDPHELADDEWRARHVRAGPETIVVFSAHHMRPEVGDQWWSASLDSDLTLGDLVRQRGRLSLDFDNSEMLPRRSMN